jgi:hypothetical protein
MHHAAEECARRRKHTFAFPSGQAAGEHVQHAGPWRNRQQYRRRQK